MKLIILIPLIACGYAAKLDRTYLPPASAGSAGGGPGSLLAPGTKSFGQTPLVSSSTFGRQPAEQTGFRAPSYKQGSTQPGSVKADQRGFLPGSQSSTGFNQLTGATQPSGYTGFTAGPYNKPSGNSPSFTKSIEPSFGSSDAGQSSYPGSQSSISSDSSLYQKQGLNNIQAYNQPQRAQAAAEQSAQSLRYDSENDGETFSFNFETSNGIHAEESGIATNGVTAQGGFGYTGDDGQDYSVIYTADENGFQPQGQHLPTPHPIPEVILKSIEENARAADAGTQEGAYRPEEYENEGRSQSYNNAESSFNKPGQAPSQLYGPSRFGEGPNQQSTVASGNQYNQQSQFGSFGPAQNVVPSGSQTSQGRAPFKLATGANQEQDPSYGRARGFNQGKGQTSFVRDSINQGQGFSGQEGASKSGYEYNRPQGSGQFGSPSSGQSSPQDTAASYSRPGSGFIQRSFGPSAQAPQPSHGPPIQQGRDVQYRPAQSTFNSKASDSSLIEQASTAPQAQFGFASGQSSANQGRQDSFGAPRQPPSFSAQEGYRY